MDKNSKKSDSQSWTLPNGSGARLESEALRFLSPSYIQMRSLILDTWIDVFHAKQNEGLTVLSDDWIINYYK